MTGQLIPRRASAEEWLELWSHRPALLRVARPRVDCAADAEDVVEEALVRAATRGLDPTAAGPWLTRVVMNLSADLHRRHRTGRRNAPRLYSGADATPDEQVCDRAEANALAESLAQLPVRQQRAVLLTAAGLSPAEIATQMNSTYKAIESLLSRARTRLRKSVLGLAWLSTVLRRLRRAPGRAALPAVSAAVLAVIVTLTPAFVPNELPISEAANPAVVARGTTGLSWTRANPAADPRRRQLEPAARVRTSPGRPATGVAPVVPSAHINAGRVHIWTGPIVKQKPDQSLLVSLIDCLRGGVTISPTYIGCRSAH